MTTRAEAEQLQRNARLAGRIANLIIEAGEVVAVFYLDPCKPGLAGGRVVSVLSFAEMERRKPWFA